MPPLSENELIRKRTDSTTVSKTPTRRPNTKAVRSIQIDFDRTFGKTGFLRYRTTLYSFYGWITDIGQKNKISDYSEYRIAYDDWVEKGSDIKTQAPPADPPDRTLGKYDRHQGNKIPLHVVKFPALLQPGAEPRRADPHAAERRPDVYVQEQGKTAKIVRPPAGV